MDAAPKLLCALMLAACVAGAALAQEDAPEAPTTTSVFTPDLESRPNPRGRRYMPSGALQRGVTGAVVLCCRPRPDRSLACMTGWESPSEFGFGQAANSTMAFFQLTEQSYVDYLASGEGRAFPRHFYYRLEGRPEPPPLPSRAERQALCDGAMPPSP